MNQTRCDRSQPWRRLQNYFLQRFHILLQQRFQRERTSQMTAEQYESDNISDIWVFHHLWKLHSLNGFIMLWRDESRFWWSWMKIFFVRNLSSSMLTGISHFFSFDYRKLIIGFFHNALERNFLAWFLSSVREWKVFPTLTCRENNFCWIIIVHAHHWHTVLGFLSLPVYFRYGFVIYSPS